MQIKKQTSIIILLFSFFVLPFAVSASTLSQDMSGKILLQVEENGEGWYVDSDTQERAYLGRPADAFKIMREMGLGIPHQQLEKYLDSNFPERLGGEILLDVEKNGEAYYVNPDDLQSYFLGRPKDAFQVMRGQGKGISNRDLNEISVYEKYKEAKKGEEKETKERKTTTQQEETVEQQEEQPEPKSVDGGWSKWSDWGECQIDPPELECGESTIQGEKVRTRTCDNPEPAYGGKDCVGISDETESWN